MQHLVSCLQQINSPDTMFHRWDTGIIQVIIDSEMKAVNTVVSNEKREKRAKSIAAMGLVNRDGDRFLVTTPSLKGQARTYEVDKNDQGSIRCTCPEFAEETKVSGNYRCEHIL